MKKLLVKKYEAPDDLFIKNLIMFDKNEDKQRTGKWLNKLEAHSKGWCYGDSKNIKIKTADFVNHRQKIAIELKREKGENLNNKDRNTLALSNRIEEYIKDANKKFGNYPGFQTLLLVELKSSTWSAQVIMSGIKQLHFINGQHVGNSIKNERLFSKMENIGAIVFWPAKGNITKIAYYFDNSNATNGCKITQLETEDVLGNSLEPLKLI